MTRVSSGYPLLDRRRASLDMKAKRLLKLSYILKIQWLRKLGTQQFRVVAYYDNGMVKDVTRGICTKRKWEVAEHDELSLMTTLRRGKLPSLPDLRVDTRPLH